MEVRPFEGLLAVDAPMAFHGKLDSSSLPAISRALLHPSRWIVHLAANLAEHLLSAAEVRVLVSQLFSESNGIGMAAAAHLAVHFLGIELARELMVARLKQPLNYGCQHIFPYLAQVWTPELNADADEILRAALFFGPRTAMASLELVRACSEARRNALLPLLTQAYDHWLQHEEPYPTNGGVIPESPRGEILTLLIDAGAAGQQLLFEAAKDPRSDVSQPARKALLAQLSTSEVARTELVLRVQSGEALDTLLRDCLRNHFPFGEQNVQSIAELLRSERASVRYAVADILDLRYLPLNVIEPWIKRLVCDPYQDLRDKAHEKWLSATGDRAGSAHDIGSSPQVLTLQRSPSPAPE